MSWLERNKLKIVDVFSRQTLYQICNAL